MHLEHNLDLAWHWRQVRRTSRAENGAVTYLSHGEIPNQALVAVIIPTYKRPDQLLLAIESVLQQTFKDVVIVVVDDAGGGVPFIDDPRIHVLRLPTNLGGGGPVRNVGVRLSESTFVAFLDDDNTWEPNHLELLVDALVADDPVAGVAYSDVAVVDTLGRQVGQVAGPATLRDMRYRSRIDLNSVLVRRSALLPFTHLRIRRKSPRGEDWALFFKLLKAVKFVHVAQTTVTYVRHPGSFFSKHTS